MKMKRVISFILCLVLSFLLVSGGAATALADTPQISEPFYADLTQTESSAESENGPRESESFYPDGTEGEVSSETDFSEILEEPQTSLPLADSADGNKADMSDLQEPQGERYTRETQDLQPEAENGDKSQTALEEGNIQGESSAVVSELTEEQISVLEKNAKTMPAEEIDRDSLDVSFYDEEAAGNDMAEVLDQVAIDDEQIVKVIIVLKDNSIIEGNAAAVPGAALAGREKELENEQNSVISTIENNVLGTPLEVKYQYTWLLNGIAAQLPYGRIREIEQLEEVRQVLLQPVYHPLSYERGEEAVKEETADTENAGSENSIMPMTNTEGGMIGRDDAWTAGYRGEGMKIAVIDTGLDDDHPSFQALPKDVYDEYKDSYETEEDISSVLTDLHAYRRQAAIGKTLSAGDLYHSTKIPYGFNYVDNTLRIDHNDSQGTHGTHVAGIAAANEIGTTEAVGVAPHAQLYVMKVFGTNGGTYTEDLLASLEDAMKLGANVINMSLGISAGFTRDADEINEIYDRVNTTGTILSVAVGNSGAMGQSNLWGSNSNLTSNPDNSMVSSPATYGSALSVASSEKMELKSYYLELNGYRYIYADGENGFNQPLTTIAGEPHQVAVIDGYGEDISQFSKAGGKIALVSRGGGVNFTKKCENAQMAGAIACVIYNNESGNLSIDMTGGMATIPCVIINKRAGTEMVEALTANPDLTMMVSKDMDTLQNDMAGQMSEFSSWGVTPDLHLEPDITAPGSRIYSTVDGGGYESLDGTSMAAPNIAGISALVLQYVKNQFPNLTVEEQKKLVSSLLVSTAEPLVYNGNGVYFSPRNQGAGLANASKAISSKVVLSVPGMDVPKAELGDNASGVYEFTFDIQNFGDKPVSYTLSSSLQTEDVTGDPNHPGVEFMSLTPRKLSSGVGIRVDDTTGMIYDYNRNQKINSHDSYLLWRITEGKDQQQSGAGLQYDVLKDGTDDKEDVQAYLDELVQKQRTDHNGANIDLWAINNVEIPAHSTRTVSVSISLNDADTTWINRHFANGIYVEGFILLKGGDESVVDLSLPFMGFYGDWTRAPIIDGGFYWQPYFQQEEHEPTEDPPASQYVNMLWTNYMGLASAWLPGMNPYDASEPFDPAHISLSPDGDGYADYIDDVYVSLLRNAADLTISWKDSNGNDLGDPDFYPAVLHHVAKSYYEESYEQIIPTVLSWYGLNPYKLTDVDGNTLADGTKVSLDIEATLDYDKHEANNERSSWITDITVDTKAPELLEDVQYSQLQEDDTTRFFVKFKLHDDVSVAAVNFYNRLETAPKEAPILLDDVVYGTVTDNGISYETDWLEVTGFGSDFAVIFGDYAFNESSYMLHVDGNDPHFDPTLLYGYRVYDDEYADDSMYGWLSVNQKDASAEVKDSEYYEGYAVTAAAYVGGYIIVADAGNTISYIIPGYWDERHPITTLDHSVSQLAFNPKTKTLYAFCFTNSSLYIVDLDTGTSSLAGYDYGLGGLIAMAWVDDGTDEGILYGINADGYLRKIDTSQGSWDMFGDESVDLAPKGWPYGVPSELDQSMTYSATENCLYYAGYSSESAGILYRIELDAESVTAKAVGRIAGNAEIVGLLAMDNYGYSVGKGELAGIELQRESLTLIQGSNGKVSVMPRPWNAELGTLVWASDNSEVAVVDNSGIIIAMGEGEATVTVTTKDGKFSASLTVKVINPQSQLYGLATYGDTLNFNWITFMANDLANFLVNGTANAMYTAAEYVDGIIYAYDDGGRFYQISADTFTSEQIGQVDDTVNDMTYDYSTNTLYAISVDSDFGTTSLCEVDMSTGELVPKGEMIEPDGNGAVVIAAAPGGMLYAVGYTDGTLYTVDKTAGTLTEVGPTGYRPMNTYQSMAFDMQTGELYWAYVGENGAYILYVDPVTADTVEIGPVDGGVQILGLNTHAADVAGRPETPVEGAEVLNSPLQILQGGKAAIRLKLMPSNTTERDVTWKIADTSIATVSGNTVTGVSVGETTATGMVAGKVEVTCSIQVLEATGELRGYIIQDPTDGSTDIWAKFWDNDMDHGEALYQDLGLGLTAGAYYNGSIYGYAVKQNEDFTVEHEFVVVGTDTYTVRESKEGPELDVMDMTFDYTEGVMYAIAEESPGDPSTTNLYYVDITDGSLYEIGPTPGLLAIACDYDGNLFAMNGDGNLCTIDKDTGTTQEEKGGPGYLASSYQSMVYDPGTKSLYWAQTYVPMFGDPTLNLIRIDPETGDGLIVGTIGQNGCQVAALHILPEGGEPAAQAPVESTKILLNKYSTTLLPGNTFQLKAVVAPVSVCRTSENVSFVSDHEEVAVVDETGLVTAVGGGSATITVTVDNLTAQCSVKVASSSDMLYVADENNIKGYSMADLSNPVSTSTNWDIFIRAAAYCPTDQYIYVVSDYDYQLYRCTGDLQASLVSETPITEQLSNIDEVQNPVVRDIEYNPFDGQMYILVSGSDDYGYLSIYSLYTVDLHTGEAEKVMDIDASAVDMPDSFTFISANEMIFHDAFNTDNIVKLSKDGTSDVLLSGESVIPVFGDYTAMTYASGLNTVYVATSYSYEGVLMALDLSSNKMTVVEGASFAYNLRDMFLVSGQNIASTLPESDETSSGDETIAYVFMDQTWEIRGLDGVARVSGNTLSGSGISLGSVTYNPVKGLFYAVDKTSGVLMAIRPDNIAGPVVISYEPLAGLRNDFVETMWFTDPQNIDIEYNAFNGLTYAMIPGVDGSGLVHTGIYTVDTETSAAVKVCEINTGTLTGTFMTAMTFVSATEAVMTENSTNSIYKLDITTGMIQQIGKVPGNTKALAYNSADGLVYMALESGALCTVNLAGNEIIVVAEAGYANISDLVLINESVWSGELPMEGERPEISDATPIPESSPEAEVTPELSTSPEPEITPEATTTPEPVVTENPQSTPEPEATLTPEPDITTSPEPEEPAPTFEATEEPVPSNTPEQAAPTEPIVDPLVDPSAGEPPFDMPAGEG